MRLSACTGTAALLLAMLAACAGPDGWFIAEGSGSAPIKPSTTKASMVKASTTRAEGRRPVGASLAMASLGTPSAEQIVDLPFKPGVGSRWIGTTEVRETTTKAGRVVETMIVRDRGEYRFVEKLDKGYRVSYTVHDGSIKGDGPLTEIMAPLIKSMKGQSFAYETDESGTPVRVVDIDKWKALAVKVIDAASQSKPELTSAPHLKEFIDGMRAQFDAATPESGVALFLEPVVYYSMVQGLSLMPVGEERIYEDEVVNPLIGAKMRARGSFKMVAVDRAKGLATVEWRLTVHPHDLNKAARNFVMRFVPEGKDAKSLDDVMARVRIDHINRAVYKVALSDGVVRRMERTSIVKVEDLEKKTVTVMTMTPAQ